MAEHSIAEILDNFDLESYLDMEGVDYKITHGSSGVQLNVKECPVCGSNKWKVYLNTDTGLGNCFAGDHPPGENFSKWSFVKAHKGFAENRDVFQHIKQSAVDMGWRARKTTSAAVTYEKPELVMPESIVIGEDGRNLKYLSDRNIDLDTVRFFHLRYSKGGAFFYRDLSDGKVKHQNYSKRIIIPIFDENGELVSFQGRDITGKSDRKYLFPPGYASTGKYLYNAFNCFGLEHVVANEGVFDVMATKIALDEDMALRDVGVVGTFGKHLSHGALDGQDQLNKFIQLKERGLKIVTIMWDAEKAALSAAIDAAKHLIGIGLVVRIARLPEGRDPNEVPPIEVRRAFMNAMPMNKTNMLKMKLAI